MHRCDYLLLSNYDIRFVDYFYGSGVAKHHWVRRFKSCIHYQKEPRYIPSPISLEKKMYIND